MTVQPTTPRLDPPNSADEVTMLRAFLDSYRATIRRQCEGLSPAQLNTRLMPSELTLGGMLKHLTIVEDWWFSMCLRDRPPAAWYADVDWDADDDWDWHSAGDDSPDQLLARYDDAIATSDANLDELIPGGGLDQLAKKRVRRGEVSLRWILVHMIEEFARHAGHADLIRESIDGAVDL